MSTEFKKVSIHSVPAMKAEADEHIADALQSQGYRESFALMDTKLVLGFSSVAMTGLMYYLEKEYKNDFTNKEYVWYLQLVVAAFFTLQSLLYLFSKFVLKDIKYKGSKKGKSITVSTSTSSKTDPNYQITVEADGSSHKITIPLNEVFFDDGYLSQDAFNSKIASFIESIDKSK
jgi:signal peptidase complex subunit 2